MSDRHDGTTPDAVGRALKLLQLRGTGDHVQKVAVERKLRELTGDVRAAATARLSAGAPAQVHVTDAPTPPPPARHTYTGMARNVELFFDSCPGPYDIFIYTLEDELAGHAWIGISASDGSHREFGFFPTDIWGAVTTGSPGEVRADHNAGTAQHTLSEQVDSTKAHKILGVIQDYQIKEYQLLSVNCSTFAAEAWEAVMGSPVGIDWKKGTKVWFPPAIGFSIDQQNRLKREILKAMGNKAAINSPD